jgi:pimeloyl-ACP methyl ester carboxylesterase
VYDFIAFNVGYRYPSRVISLISIVGSTGNPELPQSKPGALDLWINPEPDDVELAIDNLVNAARNLAGSGFIFDEEWHRKKAREFYERAVSKPQHGWHRQMLAVFSNGNVKQKLTNVSVPALVIQGTEDPIFSIEHGKDITEAIPQSELVTIEGMGHDFPTGSGPWPIIADKIIDFTEVIDS